jgi:hypothetical protein
MISTARSTYPEITRPIETKVGPNLKLDTLVMIQTNFGFNWSSSFRGEDFEKAYDVRWTMTTDTK